MRRILAAASLVTVGIALTFLTVFAAITSTTSWSSGTANWATESYLLRATSNEHARACGGRTLTFDPVLEPLARWRSKDMATRDYFSHTILGTTRMVFDYIPYRAGTTMYGENIAWNGYPLGTAAYYAYQQFIHSPEHRAIVETCRFDHAAVGSFKLDDREYFTVLFADRVAG